MARFSFIFVAVLVISGTSYAAKRVVRSPHFGFGFGGGFGSGFYPHPLPPGPPILVPHFYHPILPPPPPFGYGLSGYGHGSGGFYPGGFNDGYNPGGYYPGGLGGGLSIAKSVSISSGQGGAQSYSEAFGK